MPSTIQLSEDIRILTFDNSDSLSNPIQAALDIVGDAYGIDATWVAVPSRLLPETFFDLSTRIAGEFMQKLVNYHVKVAIVGDISAHLATSDAFSSFVQEANRGTTLWFATDDNALYERLVSPSDSRALNRLSYEHSAALTMLRKYGLSEGDPLQDPLGKINFDLGRQEQDHSKSNAAFNS